MAKAKFATLDSNGTIHYAGGHYERNVGNGADTTETITKFYHGVGRLIALRKNGTLYYVHSDHLSGTTRITDASGNVADSAAYSACGETRSGGTSVPTDRRFTGQTLDQSTGLYWYASRPYSPALARFTQPDTIVPNYSNPQTLNRYASGVDLLLVMPESVDAAEHLEQKAYEIA